MKMLIALWTYNRLSWHVNWDLLDEPLPTNITPQTPTRIGYSLNGVCNLDDINEILVYVGEANDHTICRTHHNLPYHPNWEQIANFVEKFVFLTYHFFARVED